MAGCRRCRMKRWPRRRRVQRTQGMGIRSSFIVCLGVLVGLLGTWSDAGYSDGPRREGPGKTVDFRKVRPDIGDPAPVFTLIDLTGRPRALPDYHGNVVLLNFWATWCGPCRVEMPSMEVLYQDLQPEGFEILAVSSDPEGSTVTRPFAESKGLTFPILHDPDYRVSGQYGVRTLPMSFVVNRRGTLTHRVFGARDWNAPEARTLIRGLLNES